MSTNTDQPTSNSTLQDNDTMSNPELSSLLKWSVENSDASRNPHAEEPPSTRGLNAETLNALLGGSSDADLMKEAMQVICSPDVSLADKITAFDNLEQLIENLDNANNMEPLGLWTPLLEQLDSPEPDVRKMAAWCAGTAVQNNLRSQERLLAMDGVQKIAKLAVGDEDKAVRRKCVYALSSSIRNYQPATNEALKYLPPDIVGAETVSARDMAAIDAILERLRG
jgi:hsp70-interacting protein